MFAASPYFLAKSKAAKCRISALFALTPVSN
jgi:hypothetical protein